MGACIGVERPVPQTGSFWLETAGPWVSLPAWRGDGRADVAVIGGGFTGISAALHVKERHPQLRVVVLEASSVASGASGRNAGFSMTLFGLDLNMTVLRYGKKRAKEADDYMVRAVRYTRELVERFGIDCDYEEHGLVTVATNANQARRLHKQFELARRIGIGRTEWLEKDQVRTWVDSPTYVAGWYDPLCALVNPAKLARGMAAAALDMGVEIYEYSAVRRLHFGSPITLEVAWDATRAESPRGGGASLAADESRVGRLRADRVVLATNAFSATIRPLHKVQAPMHTYIVLTERLTDEQLGAIGWRRRIGVEDGRNLIHYYRLTPDNRLLMGGQDALYYYGNRTDADHNDRLADRLQRHVKATFPALRDVRFTHHWGGPISASLDLVPVIGQLADNVVYSAGCMGHGVSLTQLNGRTLADLVFGERTELTDTFFVGRKVTPLPPEPLRFPLLRGITGLFTLQDRWDEKRGKARARRSVLSSR